MIAWSLPLSARIYSTISIRPTAGTDAQIVNVEPAGDLRKLDFGAFRSPQKPYDPDHFNFGPRAGFAWTVSEIREGNRFGSPTLDASGTLAA